jgi:1,4-dihydroxy-2-naphthoate octaprenyltransferase
MLAKLIAFVRLSRPVLLLDGIGLYALGALIARFEGYPLTPDLYLAGQLFVVALQLMSIYLNEYWDAEGDRHNTHRTLFSGGSGVLPGGLLDRSAALTAAQVCLALAIGLAALLLFQFPTGPVTWVLMVLIFLGLFFQSAPPLALMNTGYGELTTSIVFAGLVPAFGHSLFAGQASPLVLIATAPLVVLHVATLIAFSFPDYLSDEAAEKNTLLVRIGQSNGAAIHNALLAISLVLTAGATFIGLPGQVAISAAISAPLVVWQIITMRRLREGAPVSPRQLTVGAALLFGLSVYLTAFSFWVIG